MDRQPTDNVQLRNQDGREWVISNLPPDLMDTFLVAAEKMYPGMENPWMHYLLDSIAALSEMDKVVWQMTDIPSEVMNAYDEVCKQVDYTRYSLVSVLLQSAARNNLIIGKMNTAESAPGDSVAVVITGIPQRVMTEMDETAALAAKQTPQLFKGRPATGISMLMVLFELAMEKGWTFASTNPSTDAKRKKRAAASNNPTRGRYGDD